MQAQFNSIDLGPFQIIMTMILSSAHFVATIVLDTTDDGLGERNTDWSTEFWVYNILLLPTCILTNLMNTTFAIFAFWDANRRIRIMRYLSNCLELDFDRKNRTTVRFPTLNFIDRRSLLTWLQARTITLDTGRRFTIRIEYFFSYFIIMVSIALMFLFAVASTMISADVFNTAQWIQFCATSAYFTFLILLTLFSTSFLNVEMEQ